VWVFHLLGLPVSLVALLTPIDTLTSHCDGEEGVCVGVVGCGFVSCPSVITSRLEPRKTRKSWLVHKNMKRMKRNLPGAQTMTA
jgi:hypothetical protein